MYKQCSMLSSLDHDLRFDPFNYGLILCCGFICFILYIIYIICFIYFNFYYPRITKNIIVIIMIIIIIIIIIINNDNDNNNKYLIFHSIQNPKTNSCFKTAYLNPALWGFVTSASTCAETMVV